MTDSERIDWLEQQGNGCALVHNDCSHWAFATDGMQNIKAGDEPFDLQTSFFVEASKFRPTIREAVDAAIEAEAAED